MSLHLTKVAYGCSSLVELTERVAHRLAVEGRMYMTTRFIPKRHGEIAGKGSLFWIIKHQLVARAGITAFEQNSEGRWDILLEPRVVPVRPFPRRAHQGWRYLEGETIPADLIDGSISGDELPPELIGELSELSLI